MDSWADEADGAEGGVWGRLGGLGGGGRTRAGLGGHMGQTRKPGAGVPADWADRLGCARLSRLASLHLRAEGILEVLSPDADCGVIWLHTPGIHIRFFRAHIVVIFLGLTLRRRKEPLPVTSFLIRWKLSTSRILCSSKWGMPSATS